MPSADPYLPGHGDTTYDVTAYQLDLDYAIENNHLSGRATLTVRALEDNLRELTLDLHALKVVKITGVKLERHRHDGSRLRLRLASPLRVDDRVTFTIAYRGVPKVVRDKVGEAGWEELEDGVLVAGQPGGAPSWFPCNDRAGNKAPYRINVTCNSAYFVVANGSRTSVRRHGSKTTWSYVQTEPMAPYLATVQIGRYVEHEVTGGPTRTYAVVPPALRTRFDRAFADQTAMMQLFTRCFGPYPFPSYRVVVTEDSLEIPLEAQSLSIFGSNLLDRRWDSQRLIAHELAHQWFGNAVTLARLQDIWLHEGFACYSEWLWSEECGHGSTQDQAALHWKQLSGKTARHLLAAPGPDQVFDDWVYKRGALTVHAIRAAVGDESFFALLAGWIDRYKGSNATTQEFVEFAQTFTGHPVGRIVQPWLYELPLPPLPKI